MGQMGCTCGNRIGLVVSHSPHTAHVIAEQDLQGINARVAHLVSAYLDAAANDTKDQFYEEYHRFPRPDATHGEIIAGIVDTLIFDVTRPAYQCIYCGRIWFESRGSELPLPFKPEREWRGLLETQPEDFLGYEPQPALHDCKLQSVEQHEDRVDVTFTDGSDQHVLVRFHGVKSLEQKISHDDKGGFYAHFLGRWKSTPPFHRYLFEDYYDRADGDYLAIVAEGYTLLDNLTANAESNNEMVA